MYPLDIITQNISPIMHCVKINYRKFWASHCIIRRSLFHIIFYLANSNQRNLRNCAL